MTDRFDPPTVREPAEPGRPNEAPPPGREPPTRWQQRGPWPDDPATTLQHRPGAPADPATTLQHRPGAHRRPGAPADPATTLQHRPGAPDDPPTRLQQPAGRRETGEPATVLGELSNRFEPVPGPGGTARLGSGAEAEVWLVRDREQPRLAALKIYRPDPQLDPRETFDMALRDRLADPSFQAHVPLLYGWGWARNDHGAEIPWEAMEYFELGSLSDLIQRESVSGRMGLDRATEIVREIVEALVFWEDTVQQRQIDMSPGNILVRSEHPLNLVFSDFGGVRGIGLSQAVSDLQVKVGYMAPEALGNGHHSKSPYWSLGMICYQLVMGRPIIASHNEDAFRIILATDDIDVHAVPDPRWRLLIEGLLTRSIHDRWGADEVRQWLHHESPGVHRSVRSGPARQTIGFSRQQFDDRRLLAGAMMSEPDRAAGWLMEGGAARLRDWLATFGDRLFDVVNIAGVEHNEWRAHLAVSQLAAAFLRDQRPLFRGQPVDPDGILRLAQDPASRPFLHQLVDGDVLLIAARHNCPHEQCGAGPCQQLQNLSRQIPSAAAQTMERLHAVGMNLSGDERALGIFSVQPATEPEDVDRLYARAAEILISPERAQRIVETVRHGRLPRAAWWRDIERAALHADHRTADGAAAICVAAELTDRAQAYRRAENAYRKTEVRQRAGSTLSWVREQFTRNPSGRQRMFAPPIWIPRLLVFLIPLSCLDPVYWGAVSGSSKPADPSILQTGSQVMQSMHGYTRWSADWLTPWLLTHSPAQPWKAYLAYPVVLLLALAFIRRTRRRSAAGSWLALPATIAGLLFAVGLVMHLLNENLSVFWYSLATLKGLIVLAPLASLVAIRIVAGRNR